MQRTFTWFGLDDSETILGKDASGDFILDDFPDHRNGVEEFEPYDAPYKIYFDQKNDQNLLTFITAREHADEATALAFSRDHPGAVPTLGILEDNSGGTFRYLQGAAIESIRRIEITGRSTKFEYRVKGGAWTATKNAV